MPPSFFRVKRGKPTGGAREEWGRCSHMRLLLLLSILGEICGTCINMLAAVTIAGGQHPRAMAGWTCPREDECRFVVPVDDPEAAARGYTGVVMRNAPLASSAYKLGFHARGTRECFLPSNCSRYIDIPTHHPPPPGGRMCMPCWNHISRETRVGDPAAQADRQNKKRALVEPKSQADARSKKKARATEGDGAFAKFQLSKQARTAHM